MKTLILSAFCLVNTILSYGQDYYAITIEKENVTYNYPQDATFNLIAADGTSRSLENETSITVEGNYTLKVDVPWNDRPEIIKSNGGTLKFDRLPENKYKYDTSIVWDDTMYQGETDSEGKPVLIKKNVFLNKKTDKIEGYFFFSNGMVFCYVN